MPGKGLFWETWLTQLVPTATPQWTAANGCKFNLSSNRLRTVGWTSGSRLSSLLFIKELSLGDAAGLPLFPALVRYDEAQTRGVIEHAMRFVIKQAGLCVI